MCIHSVYVCVCIYIYMCVCVCVCVTYMCVCTYHNMLISKPRTQTMGFSIEQVDKDNKMFALVRAVKKAAFPKTFRPDMAPPLKACQYKKR